MMRFAMSSMRFVSSAAALLPVTRPPLVSQQNIILNFLGLKLVVEESVADTQNGEERRNLFP